MADRIQVFDVTTPAGTLSTAPLSTPLPFNQGIVTVVQVLVPPGPSGLVGFRFTHSGTVVIPYEYSDWIIADNDKIDWPVANKPTGGRWGLQSYNTDVYDHTLYISFLIDEILRPASVTQVEPIPIVQTMPQVVTE